MVRVEGSTGFKIRGVILDDWETWFSTLFRDLSFLGNT